jgi:uncharacterized protein YndB with AHSA1/START domain
MVHETDGTEMPFVGTYREVVEPERLVQALRNVDDPSDSNVEVFTTTLVDLGDGKTQVHLPPGGPYAGRGVHAGRGRRQRVLRPPRRPGGAALMAPAPTMA